MNTWTAEQGALRIVGVPEGQEPASDDGPAVLETLDSLQAHLAEGKGLAYYRNEDLGHPMIGHVVAFTYGTPGAQFPEDGPPKQCPDGLMRHITGGINWRYQLVAVTPPKEG